MKKIDVEHMYDNKPLVLFAEWYGLIAILNSTLHH